MSDLPERRTGMSRKDAYTVAAQMAIAWPHSKQPEDSVREHWVPRLCQLDLETAMAALDQLIESEEWWPAWSKFLGAYRDAARRREMDRPRPAELEEPVCPPDSFERHLADARARLAAAPERDGSYQVGDGLPVMDEAYFQTHGSVTDHATEAL